MRALAALVLELLLSLVPLMFGTPTDLVLLSIGTSHCPCIMGGSQDGAMVPVWAQPPPALQQPPPAPQRPPRPAAPRPPFRQRARPPPRQPPLQPQVLPQPLRLPHQGGPPRRRHRQRVGLLERAGMVLHQALLLAIEILLSLALSARHSL